MACGGAVKEHYTANRTKTAGEEFYFFPAWRTKNFFCKRLQNSGTAYTLGWKNDIGDML